jgi:hypothetical protein
MAEARALRQAVHDRIVELQVLVARRQEFLDGPVLAYPDFGSPAIQKSDGPASRPHTPEKSGLPSAVFGAGAARLALPSAVRGMPGVG